ncbi:MAG: hypothetical protein K2N74_06445, partial [Clostridiales bacterium]|nr:hypothetical protein [Clostridiales bacterium]
MEDSQNPEVVPEQPEAEQPAAEAVPEQPEAEQPVSEQPEAEQLVEESVETTAEADLKSPEQPVSKQVSDKKKKTLNIALLIITAMATLLNFVLLFLPLCDGATSDEYYAPVDVLAGRTFSLPLVIIGIVYFLACFAALLAFIPTLIAFFRSERKFLRVSQMQMYVTIALPLFYFITGYIFSFIKKETTSVWILLLISAVVYVAYAIVKGQIPIAETTVRSSKKQKKHNWELLVYLTLITAATFLVLALNVVKVTIRVGDQYLRYVSLRGYKLLTDYGKLESGFQLLAFA